MSLRGYASFVDLPLAPPEAWQWLTAPKRLELWYAQSARVDLRQGGRLVAKFGSGAARNALIDRLDPGRRLRLVFDPDPTWPEPLAIAEDWIIDARATRTTVRVFGEGVPDGSEWSMALRGLRSHWTVALSRLHRAVAAEQQAPLKAAVPGGVPEFRPGPGHWR